MKETIRLQKIHPIHPFPARMASSIVWDSLPSDGRTLRILDPMAGSGTTLVVAKAKGHIAIGYDTDPLAIIIARAWCTDVDSDRLAVLAEEVLNRARIIAQSIPPEKAYPYHSDQETRKFIDYWFDKDNQIQLAALARSISQIDSPAERNLLWVAFSRLIITKTTGTSLAMDVSHSRPHRKYHYAPVRAFNNFLDAVNYIIKKAPFHRERDKYPKARIERGDARKLPLQNSSVDIVITSPPYLNAIDYLRGHRLSLVWMGYTIGTLRKIRSSNIGVERSLQETEEAGIEADIIEKMGDIQNLDERLQGIIRRYIHDMRKFVTEMRRVLKPGGRAVFVVGDSTIRGVYVKNSLALQYLATEAEFRLASRIARPIPETKRYLPPPSIEKSGEQMKKRMREEVVLQFIAPER